MFPKKILPFVIVSFCCLINEVSAQSFSMKFGKIDEAELAMEYCPIDSAAGAMVIGDIGSSYFVYDKSKEVFQINYERHVRIKIFKKSGYDAADEKIALYQESKNKEDVFGLKGYTYNLEDGKVVKSKLEKEAIFEEIVNDSWTLKKFTMPNVKEGSVIEFSYTVKSYSFYGLRDWEFQKDIPVLWSEYTAKIPEFFDYKQTYQGYEPFVVREKKQSTDHIMFSFRDSDKGGYTTKTVDFQTYSFKWAAQNLPAIKEEPFITTIDDYVTKIKFDLASIQFPGSIRKDYSRSWESITKELLEYEKFGGQLEKSSFVKADVNRLIANIDSQDEKLSAIYSFIKSNIKWNGKSRLFTEKNLKNVLNEKTGNSAEINLLLIVMLKEAGLNVNPVILSTRENGRANMIWPSLHSFNYVIARVVIDNKVIFLDATDPFLPMNTLPYKCLNVQGRIISKNLMATVDIGNNERLAVMYYANYDIDLSGNISGKLEDSKSSLAAHKNRKFIINEGKDKYEEDIKRNHPGLEIKGLETMNLESLNSNFKESLTFEANENSGNAGFIYLNPLIGLGIKDNPFKLESRKFPVDIACPMEETIIVSFRIPQGLVMDEMPESMVLTMPENVGVFSYRIVQNGDNVQIVSKYSIEKGLYLDEQYGYLKEFYSQIVAKHAQQIVLKKRG